MPDHFYVYPAYLEAGTPRSLGRRVPTDGAPAEVTLDEIVTAARALGATASAEPEKNYPRQFHTYAGRVKVAKRPGVTKTRFLRELAAELRRRGGKKP
jgi:signal recognition particle subunit SEC65